MFLICLQANAQLDSAVNTEEIFDVQGLPYKPEYPGGLSAFYKFLNEKIKVPDIVSEDDGTLRVLVSFVVEKDGSITDITILRETNYELGEEVKRVLALLPEKWQPGKQLDKVVRSKFALPVVVKIKGVGKKEESKKEE